MRLGLQFKRMGLVAGVPTGDPAGELNGEPALDPALLRFVNDSADTRRCQSPHLTLSFSQKA